MTAQSAPRPGLLVEAAPWVTVQDRGRTGWAHLGVPRSGAADLGAHDAANAAVGNPAHAATLEVTASGCLVRAQREVVVAVTGARCVALVGGVPVPWGRPVRMASGQRLELLPPSRGLRTYVAVRGGIATEVTLGSRSTDVLSGLGPPPVSPGQVLPVGTSDPPPSSLFRHAGAGEPESSLPAGVVHVEAIAGPQWHWFTAEAVETLGDAVYTVTADSNRVGVRLEGPAVVRSRRGEMPSEGMVLGAIQVPASGQPIVFLADHPTTGGYPVVAVLTRASVDRMAQVRPGDDVRFEVLPARP